MNDDWYQYLSLDLPALLTALFCAVTCALLGNFLILRRQSLMGDAIAHAVLPGIVVAFLVSGTRSTLPIFIGAAAAGVLTAVLVELIRRLGRIEQGTAMGVVFSLLFAVGVLLIEQAAARSVDLDADCLLHGQLESIFWFPPRSVEALFSYSTLTLVPSELVTSALVLLVTAAAIGLFFKELTLASFDPGLSTALGYPASLIHYGLMILVAAAVVASFEAVGSILVIAMLICPPAAARLLTDRLKVQVMLSALLAAATAVSGYWLAAFGPMLVGGEHSVSAAGMIATVSGALLALAIVFAPRYGVAAVRLRRFLLALQVREEDLLGSVYRSELEQGGGRGDRIPDDLLSALAVRRRVSSGELERKDGRLALTVVGRRRAEVLIRAHRLWESFLVDKAGLRPDHVHERATELEHFTSDELQEQIAARLSDTTTDPHGRPIPKKAERDE